MGARVFSNNHLYTHLGERCPFPEHLCFPMAPGPTLTEEEHLIYTGPFPLTSLKLHVVSDKCCQETLGGVSVNHHGTVT